MTIKDYISDLIAEGKIGEAIDAFLKWAKEKNEGEFRNSAILFRSRWSSLERAERQGTADPQRAERQRNILSNSLLSTIRDINDETELQIPEKATPAPTQEKTSTPPGASSASAPKRDVILFLASNPTDSAKLQLEKEFARVSSSLQNGNIEFKLFSEWAVSPGALQQAILKYKPRIIHFSGHGAKSGAGEKAGSRSLDLDETEEVDMGGIYLRGSNGKSKLVRAGALTFMFEIFSEQFPIDAVLLNACHSEPQAEAISQFVPYVVGMNDAVGDEAAIEFSTGFYRGVADNNNIEFAFKLARNMIMLEGYSDESIPVLYKKED